MTSADARTGPCSGVRVIDFATMVAGSMVGQMLGDQGADVIKIEPLAGDLLRSVAPHHEGLGAMFIQINRNKRSICIDLKTPEGLKIARDLVSTADVVVENARPGVMERLGLGYEALRQDNPGLIYASVTGFGQTGPYMNRPAFDPVIQGLSGIMPIQGMGGPPQAIRNSIADKIAAVSAASAIVSALFYRERNAGRGQRVTLSMLDAFASFVLPEPLVGHTFRYEGAEQVEPIDMYHTIQTADGYVIGHMGADQQFVGACALFGREDLLDDPRFDGPAARTRNFPAMWAELGRDARQRTTADLVAAAELHGVPLGPVHDLQGFFDDPQVRHNGSYFDYDDPDVGVIRQLKYPADFEASPVQVHARAPRLGEHTDMILDALGRPAEETERLRAAGVVR